METAKKKRQVKIQFDGLSASVNVNGLDETYTFEVSLLSEDMKIELLRYGWKQKVSDYRASDKLQGFDKLEAIKQCHEMLEDGKFTSGRKGGFGITNEAVESWIAMSDEEKAKVRLVALGQTKKLDDAVEKLNESEAE